MFERSPPHQLTFEWSAEGSPASHIASPASDSAPRTSATSGPTTRGSSARRRRPSSSSRTCQDCARPSCVECWPTLPSSGSMRSGRLSARVLSAPRIDVAVSGSQPLTPCASTYGSNQGGSQGRLGQRKRPSLDTIEKSWIPTPTVSGEWNTQSASPRSGDGLATVAGSSIRLREWMMGAPEGWTSVDGKRLSETE